MDFQRMIFNQRIRGDTKIIESVARSGSIGGPWRVIIKYL